MLFALLFWFFGLTRFSNGFCSTALQLFAPAICCFVICNITKNIFSFASTLRFSASPLIFTAKLYTLIYCFVGIFTDTLVGIFTDMVVGIFTDMVCYNSVSVFGKTLQQIKVFVILWLQKSSQKNF